MINWQTISLRDLAGFVSEKLKNKGIDTILVGGACVSIYSENRYQFCFSINTISFNAFLTIRISA